MTAAPHAYPAGLASGAAPGVAVTLFDWDGTLSDSRAALLDAWLASSEQVLGRRYPDGPEEENVVFTLPGAAIWPTISRDADQAAALARSFQTAYEESSRSIRPFPGVVEMLRTLRAGGVGVGVVTSKGRHRLISDAARIGIADLLDVSVCAGETSAAKPDPAPLQAALARLGASPARAAMVGDTVVDITAGRAAGTRVIGVGWGHGSAFELHQAGAEAVAATPAELATILLAADGKRKP